MVRDVYLLPARWIVFGGPVRRVTNAVHGHAECQPTTGCRAHAKMYKSRRKVGGKGNEIRTEK